MVTEATIEAEVYQFKTFIYHQALQLAQIEQVAYDLQSVQVFLNDVWAQEAAWAAEQERQAQIAQDLYEAQLQRQQVQQQGNASVGSGTNAVGGSCGGATNGADQFINRESGGDPNIYNTTGSGAWGCYQIMPQTWSSSCSDLGAHGSADPSAQAACASRLPLSAWGG
jgi:hypothetical protein